MKRGCVISGADFCQTMRPAVGGCEAHVSACLIYAYFMAPQPTLGAKGKIFPYLWNHYPTLPLESSLGGLYLRGVGGIARRALSRPASPASKLIGAS